MTPRELASRVEIIGFSLVENEMAIDANGCVVKSLANGVKHVTWQKFKPIPYDIGADNTITEGFPMGRFATLDEYMYFLVNRHYSFVLNDGAIVQIEYKIQRNKIVWHRLCLYPCPIDMLNVDLAGAEIGDFLMDIGARDFKEFVRLRSPIRFDFDPENAATFHPGSHMTICSDQCRIPVKSYIDIRKFIEFVFFNFYPDIWKEFDFVKNITPDNQTPCITDDEKGVFHINWINQP